MSERALLADEAALFSSMELGRRGPERTLTTIPLSHSYGLSSIAIAALRRDMTIVLPSSDSPLDTLRSLRSANVTFFPSVPAWLDAMVELGPAQSTHLDQAKPLGTVRLVISAGAPLTPRTAQRFYERFNTPIKTFYGASECGGIAFDRTGEAGINGDLGTAVDGVTLTLEEAAPERVAGSKSLARASTPQDPVTEQAKSGVAASDAIATAKRTGRVKVVSQAVASGYLHAAASSPQETQLEPFSGGFLCSDIASLEAPQETPNKDVQQRGVLRLWGRSDEVLNLKGKKLHPSEVERVLVAHPEVREAYVFGQARSNGQGSLRLKALVAGTEQLSRASILAHCREHLTDYKVPRAITITQQLPRTERGKLDRSAARSRCCGQSP